MCIGWMIFHFDCSILCINCSSWKMRTWNALFVCRPLIILHCKIRQAYPISPIFLHRYHYGSEIGTSKFTTFDTETAIYNLVPSLPKHIYHYVLLSPFPDCEWELPFELQPSFAVLSFILNLNVLFFFFFSCWKLESICYKDGFRWNIADPILICNILKFAWIICYRICASLISLYQVSLSVFLATLWEDENMLFFSLNLYWNM